MRSRKDVISIISMIIILILCILIVSINKKYNLTIKEIETLNESIDKSNILIDTLKKENEAL